MLIHLVISPFSPTHSYLYLYIHVHIHTHKFTQTQARIKGLDVFLKYFHFKIVLEYS